MPPNCQVHGILAIVAVLTCAEQITSRPWSSTKKKSPATDVAAGANIE